MGEKRDAYVQNLKKKIEEWNSEINKLEIKSDQAKKDIQGQYRNHLEELKHKREEFRGKLEELQKAGEAAWEDVVSGVDSAGHVLGKMIEAAKSRFN